MIRQLAESLSVPLSDDRVTLFPRPLLSPAASLAIRHGDESPWAIPWRADIVGLLFNTILGAGIRKRVAHATF
jgi:hypothetical protein